MAINVESFDRQVSDKMCGFFEEVFLPGLKKLVEAGKSYDEEKEVVKIPATKRWRHPRLGPSLSTAGSGETGGVKAARRQAAVKAIPSPPVFLRCSTLRQPMVVPMTVHPP